VPHGGRLAQTVHMQKEAREDPHPRRACLLVVEDDARLRRALELLLADH